MSAPAGQVGSAAARPAPAPAPRHTHRSGSAAPARRVLQPPRTRPSTRGTPSTRSTRGNRGTPGVRGATSRRRNAHHLGFAVFASLAVGVLVIGLVTLNAFLAQASFRAQDLQHRLDGLSERYLVLTREAAHLSDPGRIATWAQRHGMRLPDDIHVLHVRAAASGGPPGDPGTLDPARMALKPIVEGAP